MAISNIFFQNTHPQTIFQFGNSLDDPNTVMTHHLLASTLFLYLETLQEVIHSSWERFAESRRENEERKNISHRIRERRVDEESAADRVQASLMGLFRHHFFYPIERGELHTPRHLHLPI